MPATKTTFFGSMFAFEQEGVDDVLESFRRNYEGHESDAPFMSYHSNQHVSRSQPVGQSCSHLADLQAEWSGSHR